MSQLRRPAITYLFAPGNRPERFDKASAAGADVVIIDWEDAVSPAEKTYARDALAAWQSAKVGEVCVRINALDSAEHSDDIACLDRLPEYALMIPKASSASALMGLAGRYPGRRLIPLIESVRGVAQAQDIARVPGVDRLAFGALDFAVESGSAPEYDTTAYARAQLVLASVLAGIAAPVDGVTLAIDDAQRITEDVCQAKRHGFRAKLCIHPKQVPIARAAFAPSAEEIAWARRVLAASAGAAVQVDGRMVDAPVIAQARQILAMAEDE